MQRLHVAYNFGCRARYNLPSRTSVSNHDSSGSMNIPTFQAILRKNMHLFLERCRKSNNVMFACFDAVRLFIFFLILWTLQPHFVLWLSARTLQCLFVWGCGCRNAFILKPVKNIGLTLSNCNISPNQTHLAKHQILSPNHQFSQRIWYVECCSVHAHMA